MADLTQAEMKQFTQLLQKALGGSGFTGNAAHTRSAAINKYKNDDDSVDFSKMKNIIKNNSDLATQLAATYKDLNKNAKSLSGLHAELEKATRNQNNTQRKAALALGDFVVKTKDVVGNLEHINKTLTTAKQSMNKSEEVFKKLHEVTERELRLKKEQMDVEAKYQKQRKEIEDQISKQKGQKKSTKQSNEKLADLMDEYGEDMKVLNDELKEAAKNYRIYNDTADDYIEDMIELDKITGTLTKEQKAALTNFKKMNAEQRKQSGVVDTLNDSIDGLNTGTKTASNHIVANSKVAGESLKAAGKMAISFGKALLTMIPGLYAGMMAKQKFNVDHSGYLEAGLRGMNEQERAEVIGSNRIGLRGLGNGNAETGFSNSKALQNTAHLFGVTGIDAIKKALEYQSTSQNLGISTSNVAGQQLQMATMRGMARQIGATDDELKNFYDTLAETGQLQSMANTASGKTEKEKQASVNSEIQQRLKLNTQLGVNLDMIKQQNQQSLNARYGGISNLIRGQVQGSMLVSQYNKSNKTGLDKTDSANFLKVIQMGGPGANTPKDLLESYNKVRNSIGTSRTSAFTNAEQSGNAKGYQSLVLQSQIDQAVGGNSLQDFDTQGTKAALRAQTQGPNAVSNKSFSDIVSEAAANMAGPTGFNAEIIKAAEGLQGFNKSPLGVSGGVGSFFGGLAAQFFGGKAVKWGAGKISKGLGAGGEDTMIGKAAKLFGGGGEAVGVAKTAGVGLRGLLSEAILPLTTIFESYNAYKDTTNGKFGKFQDSLGIKQGSVGGDIGGQTLNVLNHIGNGITLGQAGRIGADPIGYYKKYGMAVMAAQSGHPIDAFNMAKDLMFGDSDKKIGANDESRQQESDKTSDEAKKHLEAIAKNTGGILDLNKKADDKDNADDDAHKAGNVYSYYKKHLNEQQYGLS